jgi:hypothetical protein
MAKPTGVLSSWVTIEIDTRKLKLFVTVFLTIAQRLLMLRNSCLKV